jgi:hypothetical protein|tara:strand:+ start:3369 stop:3740 length:372 start_codon:yes stop_codon:yes gene_type:complete
MKVYNIYENPVNMLEAVKQGWSWPGFFFNWLWCFVKKMHGLGFALIGTFFALGLLSGLLEISGEVGLSLIVNLLAFGVSIYVGSNGNVKRQENLVSRGYELKTTVTASNPEGAIAMYMKENKK